MLQKWKCILTNWINCFCKEKDNKDVDIDITDSLLAIISYLRKNLSLDDSRSSLLEAHNIQEFIHEKYPEFKFENGTSEPITEEDLFMSGSLLLYFVCVNSKNINLKKAMCSKLSSSDQEIILKFSKCLMGCSKIASADVLTAIAEACGQDIAGVETVSSNIIAETPPALRSLHGEVRRLQAALDAERFDRNYLQEELIRTNLKFEKLSKVKEQYKLEIVNLKAKVSECCGEENDTKGHEVSHNNSIKLAKQLELTEERLANVQEELSNAEYERNTYKSKLDDLKRDRDKYLALSQQENIRACQLAEELEVERRQSSSLRELVTELRQHNRLNGIDTSLLECDDLDASVHSLLHNSSACSEVCANIIEVQLSEERAKISTLKNEMQILQDQLNDLNNKYENEKRDFSELLSDRDSNIMNLKHRINEEIERKNLMKSQYDDDITKLNNEINELEQTLKDTTDNSRKIIDTKMQEIQTLQEEKLSLLQSFSNETSKLENKIQDLKKDIEVEKCSKHKIREDYDNHIMKLNEKVLNRNNELVELQNKIVEKGEEIEKLQMQLRNEKDMRQELINKHNNDVLHYNNVIKELNYNTQKNCEEITDLRKQVQQYYQCVEEMNKERNDLNTSILNLKEDVNNLAGEKQLWLNEKEKIQHEFDEKNETVNSLKSQLQTEIDFKNEVQAKLQELQDEKSLLLKEIDKLNEYLSKTITENSDACKKLSATDLNLIKEKEISQSLNTKLVDLSKRLEELSETVGQKENEIKLLEEEKNSQKLRNEKLINDFESERLVLQNMVSVTESVMEDQKLSLTNEIMEQAKSKDKLQERVTQLEQIIETEKQNAQIKTEELIARLEITVMDLNAIKEEKGELENNVTQLRQDVLEQIAKIDSVIKEKNDLTEVVLGKKETINELKEEIKELTEDKIKLNNDFKLEKHELLNKFDALQREKICFENNLLESEQSRNALHTQNKHLEDLIKTEGKRLEIAIKNKVNDMEIILKELNTVKGEKEIIVKDVTRLQEDIRKKTSCIETLKSENDELTAALKLNKEAIIELEEKIKASTDDKIKLNNDFKLEKHELFIKVDALQKEKICLENNILASEQSRNALHAQNTHLEDLIKTERQRAEIEIKNKVNDMEIILKELNTVKGEKEIIVENITRLQEDILEKTSCIETLKGENDELTAVLKLNKEAIILLEEEIKSLNENQEKLVSNFGTEKLKLENIIAETRSVVEEQKQRLSSEIMEQTKSKGTLQEQVTYLQELITRERQDAEYKINEREADFKSTLLELNSIKEEKNALHENVSILEKDVLEKVSQIQSLARKNDDLGKILEENQSTIKLLKEEVRTFKHAQEKIINDFESERLEFRNKESTMESAIENEKLIFSEYESKHIKSNQLLHEKIKCLEDVIEKDKQDAEIKINKQVANYGDLLYELNAMKQEKNMLCENIKKLHEDVSEKTSEVERLNSEKNDLAQVIQKQETDLQEIKSSIKFTTSCGIKNIVENLQREGINSDIIRKLQLLDDSVELHNSFDGIVETVIALTKELSLLKSLEKALDQENRAVEQMTNLVRQKDDKVGQLQEEINNLHELHHASKIEFSKQVGEYKKTFEGKSKEVECLLLQNETLHNELNDVKIQLDTKIHSLKDKLIDNENITEKLKATYECQIDNLNVMVSKLSNYLKDKTVEVEALKKDKDRLEEAVNNSNKDIKLLETEIKSQRETHEKLMNEFESERVVLRNMVSVTEAVMEDQKLCIDNKMTECVKENEACKEHVKKLEEEIETARSYAEIKIKEKVEAHEAVLKELVDIKQEKLKLEEDIRTLQKDLLEKTEQTETIVKEKNNLIKDLEKNKEEKVLLEKHKQEFEIEKEKQVTSEISNLRNELEKQCVSIKKLESLHEIVLQERDQLEKQLQENEMLLKEEKDKRLVQLDEIHKLQQLQAEHMSLNNAIKEKELEKVLLEKHKQELEIEKEKQLTSEIANLRNELEKQYESIKKLESLHETVLQERDQLEKQMQENEMLLEEEKNQRLSQLDEIHKLQQLQAENMSLNNAIKEKELEIIEIKEHLKKENERNQEMSSNNEMEKINLVNKCDILQEYQLKAEEELTKRQNEMEDLQEEMRALHNEYVKVLEKDENIQELKTELEEMKKSYFHFKQEAEKFYVENDELRERLNVVNTKAVYNARKENELALKATAYKENIAVTDKENLTPKYREEVEMKIRELQNQVHDSAFDTTTTSIDSCKTITDLEKIIQDKNRTITTLHSDVTYLKTLIAESENKLLDVTKDLDLSRENCYQLSSQLKKVVHQKNEEISELKKQVSKMSVTETRATQIIKVSAKYQAMILKRIAEIKNNTVLKELTNFGNSANNCDSELRRSFNAGNITMEDLENFLDTTDRHLRRCSEKQIALQKERDRLVEINNINDSEIISMRKFLTELSVSIKTFNSVKDMYSQKLNRVIALQRTVRREILNLDGRITDAAMCRLERGYGAIMQDLSECALNLERWVDRSIVRSISPEKIKQAFISDVDRASLVPTSFQNTSLNIQLGELESSFQKLLEEVMRAQSGGGAKDDQALTLMEVRAEYEDKLSRMKAKMKELYVDQITQFKEKHREETEELERKLQRAEEKLQESSKAYQDHIRGLTTELWNVGEKLIIQKDEAQWLRKQQKSGSLMSLQHVHSTGLVAPHEEQCRPSDTHSLRSLPVNNNKKEKKEGRGLHMSDEEGEVFDNRCLRELNETPRREAGARAGGGADGGARLSELRWRNSLCPPHLKSSYPAETQFAPALQEEEIKCAGTMSFGGKQQRKEVGITAYKKPGPPTPSKQAGRLSATGSELRESLRVEAEPGSRRTATPSRLFNLFRHKNDTVEGTPRRRLSNIFRKK